MRSSVGWVILTITLAASPLAVGSGCHEMSLPDDETSDRATTGARDAAPAGTTDAAPRETTIDRDDRAPTSDPTEQVALCGDGVIDFGEACDDDTTCCDGCRPVLTLGQCGNDVAYTDVEPRLHLRETHPSEVPMAEEADLEVDLEASHLQVSIGSRDRPGDLATTTISLALPDTIEPSANVTLELLSTADCVRGGLRTLEPQALSYDSNARRWSLAFQYFPSLTYQPGCDNFWLALAVNGTVEDHFSVSLSPRAVRVAQPLSSGGSRAVVQITEADYSYTIARVSLAVEEAEQERLGEFDGLELVLDSDDLHCSVTEYAPVISMAVTTASGKRYWSGVSRFFSPGSTESFCEKRFRVPLSQFKFGEQSFEHLPGDPLASLMIELSPQGASGNYFHFDIVEASLVDLRTVTAPRVLLLTEDGAPEDAAAVTALLPEADVEVQDLMSWLSVSPFLSSEQSGGQPFDYIVMDFQDQNLFETLALASLETKHHTGEVPGSLTWNAQRPWYPNHAIQLRKWLEHGGSLVVLRANDAATQVLDVILGHFMGNYGVTLGDPISNATMVGSLPCGGDRANSGVCENARQWRFDGRELLPDFPDAQPLLASGDRATALLYQLAGAHGVVVVSGVTDHPYAILATLEAGRAERFSLPRLERLVDFAQEVADGPSLYAPDEVVFRHGNFNARPIAILAPGEVVRVPFTPSAMRDAYLVRYAAYTAGNDRATTIGIYLGDRPISHFRLEDPNHGHLGVLPIDASDLDQNGTTLSFRNLGDASIYLDAVQVEMDHAGPEFLLGTTGAFALASPITPSNPTGRAVTEAWDAVGPVVDPQGIPIRGEVRDVLRAGAWRLAVHAYYRIALTHANNTPDELAAAYEDTFEFLEGNMAPLRGLFPTAKILLSVTTFPQWECDEMDCNRVPHTWGGVPPAGLLGENLTTPLVARYPRRVETEFGSADLDFCFLQLGVELHQHDRSRWQGDVRDFAEGLAEMRAALDEANASRSSDSCPVRLVDGEIVSSFRTPAYRALGAYDAIDHYNRHLYSVDRQFGAALYDSIHAMHEAGTVRPITITELGLLAAHPRSVRQRMLGSAIHSGAEAIWYYDLANGLDNTWSLFRPECLDESLGCDCSQVGACQYVAKPNYFDYLFWVELGARPNHRTYASVIAEPFGVPVYHASTEDETGVIRFRAYAPEASVLQARLRVPDGSYRVILDDLYEVDGFPDSPREEACFEGTGALTTFEIEPQEGLAALRLEPVESCR